VRLAEQRPIRVKPNVRSAEAAPGCASSSATGSNCINAKAAKLDEMAAAFHRQSMAHADWKQQQLLLSARTRSATSKRLCRSDDCVSQAYAREVREISAIIEGRPLPDQ
jgi:hypothetical protein